MINRKNRGSSNEDRLNRSPNTKNTIGPMPMTRQR
jgi:hypothetical protein